LKTFDVYCVIPGFVSSNYNRCETRKQAFDVYTCAIPAVNYHLQVRDGAPQVLAWSPDDRWLLTCGGSSEVTRWDAASGSEARCYGGEH
ncbi:unnamed protein product, partial [Ectocarpus sp. 4 AP-2014]